MKLYVLAIAGLMLTSVANAGVVITENNVTATVFNDSTSYVRHRPRVHNPQQ
jgi:hypothetical protein